MAHRLFRAFTTHVRLSHRPLGAQCLGALGCLALLLVQGGCTTGLGEYIKNGFKVGPNYQTPPAAVSQQWIDAGDPRVSNAPPLDACWWRVFNDPTLDYLVDTSRSQNLTLREAGFRILEARAMRAYAVGNLFPQMQQGFGSYTHQQRSLESLGGFGGGGGGGGFSFPRTFDLWSAGGQLAWELDFWGRYRRAIEVADANLDASIDNFNDVLVILTSDVAAAYVEVRTLEERIRYARSNVRYQNLSLELAIDKKQEGVASQLDVAEATTNVAQTEAMIPEFEKQLRFAKNRLCVLMGMPPHEISQLLAQPQGIPTTPPTLVVGIPADLLRRRPDVMRAEREVAAQCARIGIAETELYPAFTINGAIYFEANRFNDLFQSNALAGNIGPSFNWNLLNYGRIRALIDAQEARFMQEIAQYQEVVLNANREAENAIIAFLKAQEQVAILRKGVAAAEQSRDLVNELYRGGRADFGRVFFAEYFLVQQQDALAQAEGAVAQSLVELQRALGGGWQVPPGENSAPFIDEAVSRPEPEVIPAPANPIPPLPQLELPRRIAPPHLND